VKASSLPYLLHRYAVVYAPSATALATVRHEHASTGNRTWDKTFIGFAPVEFRTANPLPATEDEVNNIASLFPHGTTTVRTRGSATRHAAQSPELQQYRYVHYATHGHADADKPQFCGVLFPDANDDILLHTFEIFNLKLTADLVTVSACNSGLGKQVRGEGMMGLMRAFFYAGTPSVCISLWPVADKSTADLMQRFYGHLSAGKLDKAEALRQAKLELLRAGGPWAHPYHWAPFILMGDWQ
jgi:CHAT domain-containing protein